MLEHNFTYELSSDFSPISIQELSEVSDVRRSVINRIIHDSSHYYRNFSVPKRTGGVRDISTPLPALQALQKTLLKHTLSKVRISPHCHSYLTNRSILTNANMHIGQPTICKIDISDFFPSIQLDFVINIFQCIGYDHADAKLMGLICTREGCLPQGAPSSPALSNIALVKFDEAMSKLCARNNFIYTRYADDIFISGQFISTSFFDLTKKVLRSFGFEANESKSYMMTRGRKIVTGISVSGSSLSVPRQKKRSIRNEAFLFAKSSLPAIEEKILKDPFVFDRIMGRLHFWRSVEPSNKRVQDLIDLVAEKKIAMVTLFATPERI